MGWYLKVLTNYFGFSGRARRRELWSFALIHFLVFVVLAFLDSILSGGGIEGYGILSGLYWLATLLPSLAVGVRRLHDTGRSGLWILISFVPILGALVLIVFFLLDSEPGTNQYGSNPKLEYA